MATLVIVDIQEEFVGRYCSKIKSPIIKEIEKAIKNKDIIVVLEFERCGKTLSYIDRAIGNYSGGLFLDKDKQSGADVIHKHLPFRTKSKNIRVCGVYTDCCVYHTAKDLKKKGWKVSVIDKACATRGYASHRWSINSLKKIGVNVV